VEVIEMRQSHSTLMRARATLREYCTSRDHRRNPLTDPDAILVPTRLRRTRIVMKQCTVSRVGVGTEVGRSLVLTARK
jgi:hypothetical protein